MDYFSFYDIPLTFHPDQNLIKKKFYALSKAYHPDFFVNESEEKQKEILHLSTLNNKAFQVLSNPDLLLAYILQLKGELVEGEKYALPQDFLMEMMEVNEALMELEFEADEAQVQKISAIVDELEEDLNEQLKVLFAQYEVIVPQDEMALLGRVKDIWYRKKYMLRIRESINRFATR
jgi:molecular chaperone HscB